jgi:hypothetical protein
MYNVLYRYFEINRHKSRKESEQRLNALESLHASKVCNCRDKEKL